jgi:hypothetical protein
MNTERLARFKGFESHVQCEDDGVVFLDVSEIKNGKTYVKSFRGFLEKEGYEVPNIIPLGNTHYLVLYKPVERRVA